MTWDALNKRQQDYLKAIYSVEQETEQQERAIWNHNGHFRPASGWRWMYYGVIPETGAASPLRRRLMAGKLVDQDTNATFETLAEHKYILLQYRPGMGDDPLIYMQITPAGRRIIRTALGLQREKPLPSGTLRKRHWRALALAWQSRPAGVKNERGYYGRISWNTWVRLRDYTDQREQKPLVEEFHTTDICDSTTGAPCMTHWIKLTPFGEQYYQENWQRYQELYPEIEAPASETTKIIFSDFI